MAYRSKIIKIGNSRGIRIPRTLLEQVGLYGDVKMTVDGERLVIQPIDSPREGWEEQFELMAELGDDKLLDEIVPTTWDEEEWTW